MCVTSHFVGLFVFGQAFVWCSDSFVSDCDPAGVCGDYNSGEGGCVEL